jgi:hypothetical protein
MGHNNLSIQEDLVIPLISFLNHLDLNLKATDTRDSSDWLKEIHYYPSKQIIEWERRTFKGKSEVWQLAAQYRTDEASTERRSQDKGLGRSC